MAETEPELSEDHEPLGLRPPFPIRELLICLGLFLTTLAAYSGVLQCQFLNFDDNVYITANAHLRDSFGPAMLKWLLFSFQPDNWFPVTRLSHLIDYTIFGDDPAAHHVVSLLIHACAALLLFGFLRSALSMDTARRTGVWMSAFGAFLFALHPLHVESVAWVAERKDVLCAFFWFATLWAWVAWVKAPSRGRYWLALVLFGLGLMSKPMIVTLPLLLLLLDVWPLGRLPAGVWLSGELLAEKIPFFALTLCDVALTWLAQRSTGAIQSLGTYALGMRLENALITPWIYIGKTLWPAKLSVFYSWPDSFPAWETSLAALGLLLVSWLAIRQRKAQPWLFTGWLWFVITLAPVIGIIQVGEQSRADRYMYVPMVGLSLLLVGVGTELLRSHPALRIVMATLACGVLIACGVRTWFQVRYWQDTETLFQHAVQMDPGNSGAWYFLGKILTDSPGRELERRAAFETAVRLRPGFVQAREHWAQALCAAGHDAEGLVQFEQTLREDPHYVSAYLDMANALVAMHRVPEAVPHYREALRLNPNYIAAHLGLGLALGRLAAGSPTSPEASSRLLEAAEHLEQAVRVNPEDASTQVALGNALSEIPDRYKDAIGHFTQALALDPDNVAANRGLGELLLRQPATRSDGIWHLETAQRASPDAALRNRLNELENKDKPR